MCNIIAILSNENRSLFRNMEDGDQGRDDSMSALMATLSGLIVGVVCDQSEIPV